MTRVKICGITNQDDALATVAAGADALGFVFYPPSPRHVTPEQAAEIIAVLPPFIQTIGLFVNENLETVNNIANRCGLDIIQLHGEEPPEYCAAVNRRIIKAFRVKDAASIASLTAYPAAAYLLDAWSPTAHGGTGLTFNWDIAAQAAASHRIILAGGLTPDNVAEAIHQVHPYAVDVSSGVELTPGKKDSHLVQQFIRETKENCA